MIGFELPQVLEDIVFTKRTWTFALRELLYESNTFI